MVVGQEYFLKSFQLAGLTTQALSKPRGFFRSLELLGGEVRTFLQQQFPGFQKFGDQLPKIRLLVVWKQSFQFRSLGGQPGVVERGAHLNIEANNLSFRRTGSIFETGQQGLRREENRIGYNLFCGMERL